MEKVKESNIMGTYFIKTYKADGMDFIELLNSLAEGFTPISVEMSEQADRDMKSFGSKSVPYQEFMEHMDTISDGIDGSTYKLIGTVGQSVVDIAVSNGFVTVVSKDPSIEIDSVVKQKTIGL